MRCGHGKQWGKCRKCRGAAEGAGGEAAEGGEGRAKRARAEAPRPRKRFAHGRYKRRSARTVGGGASVRIGAGGACARTVGARASASKTASGASARTAGARASASITAAGATARTAGARASARITARGEHTIVYERGGGGQAQRQGAPLHLLTADERPRSGEAQCASVTDRPVVWRRPV